MKSFLQIGMGAALGALMLAAPMAMADDDKIIVGFATAQSGFMQAYDKPAEDAAKIRIDEMITHTMPLKDINRAFDLMHSGESIRSVVLY